MFIDGLDITVRTLVQRCREIHGEATYIELVKHAKHKREAVHADTALGAKSKVRSTRIVNPGGRRTVDLFQSSANSNTFTFIESQNEKDWGGIHCW